MKRQTFQDWCDENGRIDLLSEWDAEKNSELGYFPGQIGCKSSTYKVWWRCKLGHSFDMLVGNRTSRNDGCPFCSNHRLCPICSIAKTISYSQKRVRNIETGEIFKSISEAEQNMEKREIPPYHVVVGVSIKRHMDTTGNTIMINSQK